MINEERELTTRLSDEVGFKYAKVYRAVKQGVTSFFDKDYVTLSKRFAQEHAENNHVYYDEPFDVIYALISTDKLYNATNPSEYFYSGKPKLAEVIYSSLGPDEFEGFDESYNMLKESIRIEIRKIINKLLF